MSEEVQRLPVGTSQVNAERQKQLAIDAGATSAELTGSEEEGWTLTITWASIG